MKKFSTLLIAMALAATTVGCAATAPAAAPAATEAATEAQVSEPVTVTGKAQGNGGEVTVTLTLQDNVILEASATGDDETPGIGVPVIESFPGLMVERNSVEIDAVSGATVTSTAVVAAATDALAQAGLKPADLVANAAEGETEALADSYDVDVVVLGAGGAGTTAAIVAADDGKKVLVLESQAFGGGNSVRSTGGMNAADTPYQDENEFAENAGVEKTIAAAEEYTGDGEETIKELLATVKSQYEEYQKNPEGYFDSVELFELDTMLGGKGINDPVLVETLAENADDGVEWLKTIDANLDDVASFGGASVKRIHRPVDDEGKVISVGAYLVPILEKAVEEKDVEVLYSTTATKILMDDNKAVGVEAVREDGSTITVNAKSVVIATGGFGGNNDMVKEQNPILDGYITTNAPGIQGQGIEMAEEVGAALVDMNQIQLHPTVHVSEDGAASLITEGLRGDGAILVNTDGKRFYDEVSTRDKVSDAENNQPGGFAWLIVDKKMYDASKVIQGYVTKGFAVEGATPEELAAAMEVDPAALAETIETWNGYVAEQNDPDFGRTSFAQPLEEYFYAITVQPGVHHTMGGVKINENAQVLKEDGTAIDGLYAAGEVTGGVHGANRLGGNAVADFVVFGRIAGQNAADYTEQ